MNTLGFTRGVVVAAVAGFIGLAVACSSESSSGPETFCGRVQSSAKSCTDGAPCDATLAKSCSSLEKVLSPSTIAAAQSCLDTGICSSSYCLTRAQKSSEATDAHNALAEAFCTQCAPDVADCQAQFYTKQGNLPGGLVLPYGATVAAAVKDACTGDPGTCRASFASCATDAIAMALTAAVDGDTATCITAGFQRDDQGPGTGPTGGPQTLTCTSRTCKGCCRDDRCIDGTAQDACGVDGQGCQTCGDTQQCKAGQCYEPCGPNNCKGCCDGDACVVEQTTEKCGGAGAACESCKTKGSSFVCSNQTCIDGACAANCTNGCCGAAGCQPGTAGNACGNGGEACVDCGYGHTCGDAKACELNRNSTWNLVVLSAVVPATTKSGGSWEIFGDPPDPYVVAYTSVGSGSSTGKTSVKNDTLTPTWGEAPLTNIKASELMNNTSFEIWDSDYDFDDLIGGCAVSITPDLFDGKPRQVTCPPTASNVSVSLTFKIVKP